MNTETSDPDYKNLEDTLEKISNLSENILKSNVKSAEMTQILAVQKKLNGYSVINIFFYKKINLTIGKFSRS